MCNDYGFQCEERIRGILPKIGFVHSREARHRNSYWWANKYEDHILGVDCWLRLDGVEYPVDFTVISDDEMAMKKTQKAVGRGVIPIFLPCKTLDKAHEGYEEAAREVATEIVCQIVLKRKMVERNMIVRNISPNFAARTLVAVH